MVPGNINSTKRAPFLLQEHFLQDELLPASWPQMQLRHLHSIQKWPEPKGAKRRREKTRVLDTRLHDPRGQTNGTNEKQKK